MKKQKLISLIFLLSVSSLFAQQNFVFHIDSIPIWHSQQYTQFGIALDKFWKYHKGDDSLWAAPDFDDSGWDTLNPVLNFDSLKETVFENIGWFRLHIEIDTQFVNQTAGLMLTQSGASEIFLDGKLIHSFGKIRSDNSEEERFDPQNAPVDIHFEKQRRHLLAVRYSNSSALAEHRKNLNSNAGFAMKIGELRSAVEYMVVNSLIITAVFVFYFTFFIALSFLHLMFFFFYRKNKSNLYYSIFAAGFGSTFLWLVIQQNFNYPDFVITVNHLHSFIPDIYMPALIAMLYVVFYKRLLKIFWLWVLLYAVDFVSTMLHYDWKYYSIALNILFIIESFRVLISSMIRKREGAWIIGTGVITTVAFFTVFSVLAIFGYVNFHSPGGWTGFLLGLLVIYCTLSIPLSMTIYLARDFARTSKNLSKKLVEVENLSARTIAQEKEKQEILSKQKENLEIQVTERTKEVVLQKKVIEEKNKDITDSINYAKRIQDAILPSEEQIKKMLPDSFVLFKPKDIVSGDFYFFAAPPPPEGGSMIVVAAVDCTGHGVPGAFMSMVGHNHLKRIVNENKITDTSKILDELHKQVLYSLNRDISKRDSKDGMDVSIVSIDKQKREIQFSGAVRPLYYFVNGKFFEVKGERYSIAGVKEIGSAPYASTTIAVTEPTSFYLFSDGFADQFGGKDGKKLMSKNFRELLTSIQSKSLPEQKTFLDNFIEEWKDGREQMDDIMVIGIRI